MFPVLQAALNARTVGTRWL